MVAEVLVPLSHRPSQVSSPLANAMLACSVLVSKAKMFIGELSLK